MKSSSVYIQRGLPSIMEKIVGTPDVIYNNFTLFYHRNKKKKMGMALFNKKQKFLLLWSSFPVPNDQMSENPARLLTT